MKAVVFTKFGPPDVLRVGEVAAPVVKRSHDVLIRVRATSVNFGDTLARNFAAVSPHLPHAVGTPRLAFVKSLGAHSVIDYTHENFIDHTIRAAAGVARDIVQATRGPCRSDDRRDDRFGISLQCSRSATSREYRAALGCLRVRYQS